MDSTLARIKSQLCQLKTVATTVPMLRDKISFESTQECLQAGINLRSTFQTTTPSDINRVR